MAEGGGLTEKGHSSKSLSELSMLIVSSTTTTSESRDPCEADFLGLGLGDVSASEESETTTTPSSSAWAGESTDIFVSFRVGGLSQAVLVLAQAPMSSMSLTATAVAATGLTFSEFVSSDVDDLARVSEVLELGPAESASLMLSEDGRSLGSGAKSANKNILN